MHRRETASHARYITWVSQKICNILVRIRMRCVYDKPWRVPALLVGALTHCALLHSVCDFKAAQMNVQRSLHWELMLYESELSHNAVEVIKNNCCAKSDITVDYSIVTRCLKKFHSGNKKLNN